MSQLTIAGNTVDVNEEGYLIDTTQWTEDVAQQIAQEENIQLTDRHFEVLNYLRAKHNEGVPISIRKVGKSGVVDIKEFYKLFPGGPLKKSSRIAGIPKPVSCV